MLGGVYEDLFLDGEGLGGDGVYVGYLLYAVAKEFDADGEGFVGGVQLDDVAADAERASLEVDVVSRILDIREPAKEVVPVEGIAGANCDDAGLIVFGRAEAEDAGDRGDDDAVVACREAGCGGEAEAVEVVVLGGVLLDVDVSLGDVGLGLVVVVVADEVFDGVFGEKLFEFLVKLGGEGLVVRYDQDGQVELGDDVGHCEGLAGACDAH